MLKKYIIVFLISMVPLIELRGAVPYAVGFNLPLLPSLLIAVVGNMLPVPFIFLFARKVLEWGKGKVAFNFDNKYINTKGVSEEDKKRALDYYIRQFKPGGDWALYRNMFLSLRSLDEAMYYWDNGVRDVMFCVEISKPEHYEAYDKSPIPWDHIIAASRTSIRPEMQEIYRKLHEKGVMIIVSVTQTDDKIKNPVDRRAAYMRTLLSQPDLIETDYPADCAMLNTGKDVKGWSQGYKSVKYFVIPDDFKNGRNQSNDLPIFRFADILLTKAEAIVRGANATNGETAQSLFNQIRTYAGAPTLDHEPSLQELLDERGRELFDENWRRNDMIRFGTFESEYGFHLKGFPTARFDKECRLFPIPQDVLNSNTHWQQNAGYGK